MRRLAALPLIIVVASIVTPARAQIAERHRYEPIAAPNPFIGDSRLPGPGLGRDLRDIRRRIDRARDSGAISHREARQLRREARLIGWLAGRYAAGGLSPSESRELAARALVLRSVVNRSGR